MFYMLIAVLIISSCSEENEIPEAFGNFEANEIVISAEVTGNLLTFNLEEGQKLEDNQYIGYIDTTQLSLKRRQLDAQRSAISSKVGNILAQISVLEQEKKSAIKNQKRILRLFRDSAATQKEVDDIADRIEIYEKQIKAIETQNNTVLSEIRAMDAQIAIMEDNIKKSVLKSPIKGTVLNKYVEEKELVSTGKPLYKIADLNTMVLRVYISGDQLADIKIGQAVDVLIDKDKSSFRKLKGKTVWISSKTEFTPKTIQTKEERVNMVYAVKVQVQNDGSLKIGMPGEVVFKKASEEAK